MCLSSSSFWANELAVVVATFMSRFYITCTQEETTASRTATIRHVQYALDPQRALQGIEFVGGSSVRESRLWISRFGSILNAANKIRGAFAD